MSKSGGASNSPYPMKSFAGGGSSSKNQQSDGPFVYKAKGNTKFKPKKLVVSKSSLKGDPLDYDKAMKEFKQELSKKGSSSSKRGNQEDKQAASKTEVVERKIEIDKAEDDEDSAENALRSVRELAHARYLRNHRLINEIFSPDMVFPTRPVISQAHVDNLKATVQRLTAHREKLVSDIDKMEERFRAKKQSVLEAIDVIMKLDKKEHYIKMAQERIQQQQQQQQQQLLLQQQQAAAAAAAAAAAQAVPSPAVAKGPADQVVPQMAPPGFVAGAGEVPVAPVAMAMTAEGQSTEMPPPVAPSAGSESPAVVQPVLQEPPSGGEAGEAMEVDSADQVGEGQGQGHEEGQQQEQQEMAAGFETQPVHEQAHEGGGGPVPEVPAPEAEIPSHYQQQPPPATMEHHHHEEAAEPVIAPEPSMDQVPIVPQINPSFQSPPPPPPPSASEHEHEHEQTASTEAEPASAAPVDVVDQQSEQQAMEVDSVVPPSSSSGVLESSSTEEAVVGSVEASGGEEAAAGVYVPVEEAENAA